MSDDTWGGVKGGINDREPNLTSKTRLAEVTEQHDVIFDALSAARRRYLLYYLQALDTNVVEFEAAVNAVCKCESSGTDGDEAPRETVRIDLHHTHVPRLEEAGILDYDRRQGTIRFRGDPALEEWAGHARWKEFE